MFCAPDDPQSHTSLVFQQVQHELGHLGLFSGMLVFEFSFPEMPGAAPLTCSFARGRDEGARLLQMAALAGTLLLGRRVVGDRSPGAPIVLQLARIFQLARPAAAAEAQLVARSRPLVLPNVPDVLGGLRFLGAASLALAHLVA